MPAPVKNILLVANWESGVGYAWWLMESFWAEIARHFSAYGQKCYLIYPRITTIPRAILQSPIEILEHDFSEDTPSARRRLARIIRENNIGYIYLTDKRAINFKYLWLRLWGVRRIVIHDHTPGERSIPRGIKRTLKKLAQRAPFVTADHFVAVTTYVRDRFIHSGCIPAEKCSTAQNGIVPIGRHVVFSHYCHRQFGIPEDATLVITSGRANLYKGIDFIIRCAAVLVHERAHRSVFFIHCGDGPNLDAFKQLAKELSVDHRFIFAGRRDDVRLLLQSCHIGIQASQGEVGYSLSTLEYMSAGLATLTPDFPSAGLATKNGVTGLHFSPGNIRSACEQLQRLIVDPVLRQTLASNAMRAVETDYNLQRTKTELIMILDDQFRAAHRRHTAGPRP